MREITESVNGVEYTYQPITEEAAGLVFGDRLEAYGHPCADFNRTAGFWSVYKGIAFTPEDVAAMMTLVKLSRQTFKPKRDNTVDAVGYLECLQRIIAARKAGVLITDWAWVGDDMAELRQSAEELDRVNELVPTGVSIEDLVACWEAHHPFSHELAPVEDAPDTRSLVRALLTTQDQGIGFTEGQLNLLHLFPELADEALRENWDVRDFNRSAYVRGQPATNFLTLRQWTVMTTFYAAESHKDCRRCVTDPKAGG